MYKDILELNKISYDTVRQSDQGQTNIGYFVDDKYFLKIYSNIYQYKNTLHNIYRKAPQIFYSGEYDDIYYIIFEQIKGKTLAEVIYDLNQRDSYIILCNFVKILKDIHENMKIAHGDFHIGNIIILENTDIYDIQNYIVIDRDDSGDTDIYMDIGGIIENIVITPAIVSLDLEKYYSNNLHILFFVIYAIYPDMILQKSELWLDLVRQKYNKKLDFFQKNGGIRVLDMYHSLKNFEIFLVRLFEI